MELQAIIDKFKQNVIPFDNIDRPIAQLRRKRGYYMIGAGQPMVLGQNQSDFGQVLYIGQSLDIGFRLVDHTGNYAKEGHWVRWCEDVHCGFSLEAKLIDEVNPEFNVAGKGKSCPATRGQLSRFSKQYCIPVSMLMHLRLSANIPGLYAFTDYPDQLRSFCDPRNMRLESFEIEDGKIVEIPVMNHNSLYVGRTACFQKRMISYVIEKAGLIFGDEKVIADWTRPRGQDDLFVHFAPDADVGREAQLIRTFRPRDNVHYLNNGMLDSESMVDVIRKFKRKQRRYKRN